MTKKRFSELTKSDKEFIKQTYHNKNASWDENLDTIRNKFGIGDRTVRFWYRNLNLRPKNSNRTRTGVSRPKVLETALTKDFSKDKKYFLITSAQNATPVHENFLKNMEAYAEFLGGEILVIPIRYSNPTSLFSEKDEDWWDVPVVKYLSLKRHTLNNNVTILSDVKTQPTNSSPLRGFEGLCGNGSAIIAHPRMHTKALPTLDEHPKMLFTTGICTQPNYTDSRIGKLGEFHHVHGFCIVEIEDENTYFIRQVSAKKDGSFADLFYETSNGQTVVKNSIKAIIKGDVHHPFTNKEVLQQSKVLINKTNPDKIVLHDVGDLYSINHHEENNFIKQYHKENKNQNSVQDEVESLLKWIDEYFEDKKKVVIVNSNHDRFLEKWILGKDSNLRKTNPKNITTYLSYAQLLLENRPDSLSLLGYLIKKKFPEITCLKEDQSYKLLGWELGVHGDVGSGGTKGTPTQYRNLNTHIVIGHSHTPNTMDGEFCVGTNSELRLGYNHGLSSWVHSDVILHENGRCQHIYYIGKNKEFTTLLKSEKKKKK